MSEISKQERREINDYAEDICNAFIGASEFFSEEGDGSELVHLASHAPDYLVVEFFDKMEEVGIEVAASVIEVAKAAKRLACLEDAAHGGHRPAATEALKDAHRQAFARALKDFRASPFFDDAPYFPDR
jgi:hypothetical protein